MIIRFARTCALLALLLTVGCEVTGPGVGPPASLTPAPIPSVIPVGETITVAVTVRDAETRPVPGVPVSWTASDGTSVNPASGATNESGVAYTSWSLGPNAGEHTLTVRAAQLERTLTATTRAED